MGDLVRVRTFFPQHIAEQDFFSALYAMSDMFFFSAVYFSPQVFPCTIFPLELSRRDIFSEITHNPLKRQMVGPEVHQTFALYSFFLRIVKDWNILQTISSMMKLTLTKRG